MGKNGNSFQIEQVKLLLNAVKDAIGNKKCKWEEILEKPETYPPSAHDHNDLYYRKEESDEKYQPKGNYIDADGEYTVVWDKIDGKPETFPPSAHTHDYLPLTGGTMTGPITIKRDGATDNIVIQSASGDAQMKFIRTDTGADIHVGVGSGGDNAGIWDGKNNKWIVYSQASTGNVYVNGIQIQNASGKMVRSLSNVGASGWKNQATDDNYVPTLAFMAFWNGAYSGTASNLQYCDRGRFGTIVTKGSGDYAAANHSHSAANTGAFSGVAASGNGYVRFTDGTQICWGGVTVNSNDSTDTTITFPQPFVYVNGTPYGLVIHRMGKYPCYITGQSMTYVKVNTNRLGTVFYSCVGRWK